MEHSDLKHQFLKKFYEHQLPDTLLHTAPPAPREGITAMVGWLLFDWFTEKVAVKWVPDEMHSHYRFTIKRWGEDFSFNIAPGGLMALVHALEKQMPQGHPTLYAHSPVSGIVVVPDWAFDKFLRCIVNVLPDLRQMAQELEDTFNKQVEVHAPTLH